MLARSKAACAEAVSSGDGRGSVLAASSVTAVYAVAIAVSKSARPALRESAVF